jgi:hypothetical protein
LTLWIASHAFEKSQEDRKTYRYLADALANATDTSQQVIWRKGTGRLVRPLTPVTAKIIGRALTESWQILAIAQSTGEASILADRFTGVALERAEISTKDATNHGGKLVVLQQVAEPVFYHLDGSLLQARLETLAARFITNQEGFLSYELTKDTGIVTLMNESAGWRVYSYERTAAEPMLTNMVPWEGSLQGVNYYPTATPWRAFWSAFDEYTVAADLERISDLGANSVRIFLTREDFLSSDFEAAITKLEKLLQIADEKGLSVVPTFFDLKQDFNVGTWSDDVLYLERVLPILAASETVAFVDLKNEADLDFEAHGDETIVAWLQSMAGATRVIAPNLSLTIGWSNSDSAALLTDTLDVITYHDYAPLDGTASRLASVRKLAGDKPVLVTEIGVSSFELIASFPGSEERQANQISDRLGSLTESDGVFLWTLYDFENVDGSVVGNSPWVKRLQQTFGIFRADGSAKPIAAAVTKLWANPR